MVLTAPPAALPPPPPVLSVFPRRPPPLSGRGFSDSPLFPLGLPARTPSRVPLPLFSRPEPRLSLPLFLSFGPFSVSTPVPPWFTSSFRWCRRRCQHHCTPPASRPLSWLPSVPLRGGVPAGARTSLVLRISPYWYRLARIHLVSEIYPLLSLPLPLRGLRSATCG